MELLFFEHKWHKVSEEREVEGNIFYSLFRYSAFWEKKQIIKGFKKNRV